MLKALRRSWVLETAPFTVAALPGTNQTARALFWTEDGAIRAAAAHNQSRAGLSRRCEVKPRW